MNQSSEKQQKGGYYGSAMETGDHFKNGVSLKSQMNKENLISMKYLALIILVISIVACGKISKQIQNEIIEPKLSEEQLSFCENFFIAIQVKRIVNSDRWGFYKIDSDEKFHAVTSLLSMIKYNGYDAVINAFEIPSGYDYEQKKAYTQSILEDLQIDAKQSFQSGVPDDFFGFFKMNTNDIFQLVYSKDVNSKLKYPEFKTVFVEKLDNGNEIWLLKDYQSMKQARLIVKQDGGLSIGNLTDLETVITH
jgi:hypothetical protein